MVDRRKSPHYKELRAFVLKDVLMEFKATCKGIGININEGLQEAVQDWIFKQKKTTGDQSSSQYQYIAITESNIPTIATAIKKTFENEQWALEQLENETTISQARLQELLAGDLPTNEEVELLADCLMSPEGIRYDKQEISDMCTLEEIQQRHKNRNHKARRKANSPIEFPQQRSQ